MVTKKMLDMFRRPDDPPEYNHYYLLPGVAAMVGSTGLYATGMAPAALTPMLALGSALGCVGGISCLSSQTTGTYAKYVCVIICCLISYLYTQHALVLLWV